MRVVLVAPSVKDPLSSQIPDGISKSISRNVGIYPPLGLCYIAETLRRGGHEVTIVDTLAEGLSIDSAARKIISLRPGAVGITCMSFTYIYALELARLLRKEAGFPVIIGGDHPSLYPEEVMRHRCFDYAISGEGERTFLELIDCLSGGKAGKADLSRIDGLSFRSGSQVVINRPRQLVRDIDTIPIPARDLLDIGKYYTCNLPKPFTTLITSRGCPYNCEFCSKTSFGESFRFHSAGRVVDEIEHCIKDLGIRAFDIFDDTFTFDKKRIRDIAGLVRKRGLRFEFSCMTRVDLVDREILRLLREMGCRTIAYGIETGTEHMLASQRKNFSLTQSETAIRLTREAGIESFAMVMIGLPGETEGEIRDTIAFLNRNRPAFSKCNIFCLYPGSRLYSRLVSEKRIDDFWRDITLSGRPAAIPPVPDTIPQEKLVRYRAHINRMNYLRLDSNLFKLGKIRNWSDIKRVLSIIFKGRLEKEI